MVPLCGVGAVLLPPAANCFQNSLFWFDGRQRRRSETKFVPKRQTRGGFARIDFGIGHQTGCPIWSVLKSQVELLN